MQSLPIHKLPNVLAFLCFRVFFKARFYYPVMAILFLDLGLTLAEFSLTNLVWAIVIVCFEVPSGALADTLGRKRLLILASVCMIAEMLILAVVPIGYRGLLALVMLNRILSGVGEAMASGADEALVYDSLCEAQAEDRWPEVLERQQQLSSAGFFVAMLLGAASFDSDLLNQLFNYFGLPWQLTPQQSLRIPIYFTLVNAILALLASCLMRENRALDSAESKAWAKVWSIAKSLPQRLPLCQLIFAIVILDQAARLSLTTNSKTFHAYGIPEVYFGVIGALSAVLGFAFAGVWKRVGTQKSQGFAFWLLAGLVTTGLLGQALSDSKLGVLFVALLSLSMSGLGYFSSLYLNRFSSSHERATLLSFKGLACNLGFGAISLYYAAVTSVWPSESPEQYLDSLLSLPAYFALSLLLFLAFSQRYPLQSGVAAIKVEE